MLFKDIVGQDSIKDFLSKSADRGRVSHAQLFVGPEGSGTLPMAIAYAQYLLCKNINSENSGGNESCNLKFEKFAHPDLHFAFPVNTTDKVKKNPVSANFMEEWRELLKEQPYANLFDWYKKIGIENKQGQLGKNEASEITKSLSLKSYEGGYKIMLIWMAELMNATCSNKLLKLIEEPPEKTIFLLIAEDEEGILTTIRSRCQVVHFPPLAENDIQNALMDRFNLEARTAAKIAHQSNGNFNKAADLVYQDSEDLQFEKWFVIWVRAAFKAKGNKSAIHDLISWSEEVAKTNRETQKKFLLFSMEYFRQALLTNYQAQSVTYIDPKVENFELEKFSPFVHSGNIMEIYNELQDAHYHIGRNGNSKIVLTDLSIKITRLLHTKPQTI